MPKLKSAECRYPYFEYINRTNLMKIAVTLFWIIIVALLLGLFSLNVGQTVNIDLLFTELEKVNLVAVIYVSVLAGFLLGLTFWLVRLIKGKKEEARLRKTIKRLNEEMASMNNTNVMAEQPRLENPAATEGESGENT